jgi:hypothetical protein
MTTLIILLSLIGLLAIASAFAATKKLRYSPGKAFASASVATISTSQLAPEAVGYTEQPIDQLLAAAEEVMRTHPAHIEYRRQQQIKHENDREARQAASAARKQRATQQQPALPQAASDLPLPTSAVADVPTQKPAKKAAEPKPTWEDIEALRKKRETLPPLPTLAGDASSWFLSPKLEPAMAVHQWETAHPQTVLPARSFFQRTIAVLTLAAQRCQALVQQTTRLAQSIPRIFNFLAPRFWQKCPPDSPSAKNPR